MSKTLDKSFLTVSQAAESLGVTTQRVYQLLKTYGVECQQIGNLKIISTAEMRKIPRHRPPVPIEMRKKRRTTA